MMDPDGIDITYTDGIFLRLSSGTKLSIILQDNKESR